KTKVLAFRQINCKKYSKSSTRSNRRIHDNTAGWESDSPSQKASSKHRAERSGLNQKDWTRGQRSKYCCRWHNSLTLPSPKGRGYILKSTAPCLSTGALHFLRLAD